MYDGSQDDSTNNVDKIRDILFGGQMRDYERRFAQLEQRLQEEARRLRADYEQRALMLEQAFQRELERVNQRVTADRQANVDAQAKQAHTIDQLEQLLVDETTDLRTQMGDQAKVWADTLHTRAESLQTQMTTDVNNLREEKVSRQSLATLLNALATQIQQQ